VTHIKQQTSLRFSSVALELKSNAKFRTRTIKKLKLANVMIR